MSEETNESSSIVLPEQTEKKDEESPHGESKERETHDDSPVNTLLQEPILEEQREMSSENEQKQQDIDFANAIEHILSSPSDLTEVVTSFENLQPIYGSSRSLTFQSDSKNSPPKEPEEKKKLEDKKKKSIADKTKKSSEGKKDEWETKRDRRKSSVYTDADVSRKSSDDPYPIGIPLKKQVNKSTRKKLWREIQKRKPFITQNVLAHIQHFAKPPFRTFGCNNCNFRKDVRSYSYEYWNM